MRLNTWKSVLPIVACAMLGITSGTTQAGPLNITSIDGGWQNANPGANITALSNLASPSTDKVRWGGDGSLDNASSGSGYNFAPGADIINVPLSTALALGVFTHINQPIPSGSSITSIDYAFNFTTNGVPMNLNTVISFNHNETPNGNPNPSLDDDIVTITSVILNQNITVGTDVYFFSLLGFSLDGGNTFSNVFFSPEGGSNNAGLYGIVTLQPFTPGVPVPGTAVLLVTGVMGLAGFRKKKVS